MGGMLFDFDVLGKRLRSMRETRQRNPRRPLEYVKILRNIAKWSAGGKDKVELVTGNSKINKAVAFTPISGSRKLDSTQAKVGWVTKGLALMPATQMYKYFTKQTPEGRVYDLAKLARFNIGVREVENFQDACPFATKGCMAVCLSDSGKYGQEASTQAMVKRHLIYELDRKAFMTTLAVGLASKYQYEARKGYNFGVRLNVTSDIDWENIPLVVDPWLADYLTKFSITSASGGPVRPGRYPNIMRLLPNIMFYDYTKVIPRMDRFLKGRMPQNYHLVFSLAETTNNRRMAIRVLRSKKTTVSVPFYVGPKKNPLPKTLTIIDNTRGRPYHHVERPVFNADEHDMRALDKPGSFAGLKFKITMKEGERGKYSTVEKVRRARGFVIPSLTEPHPFIFVDRKKARLQLEGR